MSEYIIDAKNRKLGRMATEIADILRGKNSPDFAPNKLSGNRVNVINAKELDISRERLNKEYSRYSGYPGGRRVETMQHLIDRRGIATIVERAVYGMLPNNKLRSIFMRNLKVSE